MAVHFEIFPSVEAIERGVWNHLAAHASPMMEWEYYHALESSGSVSLRRGYVPCHLMAYADDHPVALAPLYERNRAWVEFGDGGLLEFLTELTGLPFNHGVVGTIPFTPVPGYTFLHSDGTEGKAAYKMLLSYIDQLCESRGLSTCRIYFVSNEELHSVLREEGFLALESKYSLWFNRNYSSFEDYLNSFKSSRRTKIRREIKSLVEKGIDVKMIQGVDAPIDCYEDLYQLYVRTWTKHMGQGVPPFLNRAFFESLEQLFRHRTSFSLANRRDERVAMALFYNKTNTIYGRYWGCFEEIPFLHFLTCYYRPIAYAIQKGIGVMDPGFGGEHKLIRGYEVVPVYHYIKFYGDKQRQVAKQVLQRVGLISMGSLEDGR